MDPGDTAMFKDALPKWLAQDLAPRARRILYRVCDRDVKGSEAAANRGIQRGLRAVTFQELDAIITPFGPR